MKLFVFGSCFRMPAVVLFQIYFNFIFYLSHVVVVVVVLQGNWESWQARLWKETQCESLTATSTKLRRRRKSYMTSSGRETQPSWQVTINELDWTEYFMLSFLLLSGQVLAKCIWSGRKPVCKNPRAWFLAECSWPATSFPLSDLVAFFHRWPWSYYAKPAWIWFGSGWLSGFNQTDPVQKQAGVCKSHLACFWPMLPSWSGSDANRIWHVYWVRSQGS